MDIRIIAVGKVKDRAYLQKIGEYYDRIRHDAKLQIVEIRDAGREEEGRRIVEHLRRLRAYVIALDEKGKMFTSQEFAKKIVSVPRTIAFVIGGPDGLSDEARKSVRECVALSPLTFTHEIARLLLAEQLYRAISIVKNRKYHKG
ncbi:MAG: 23S rRNA (pseudouridine(1915)-N(3))-methyltransferase RlmH [Chitinispirillaceae bacterium]|nr:23S rRNA (pseudouridine(1915)-N(3))-methyltransferase RlmH [Chitinispirillaceae bacterium]